MTSKLTRERLLEIAEDGFLKHGESKELASMVLAALDTEPVAEVLSNRPGNDSSTIDRALPVGTQLYRHAQPAPEYPEVLPCPVLLEPGLRFGKGIKTSTMLAALARRAVYESDMAALSPEERAEFQARIEDFKSLIAQQPVVPDERDKAVDADDHPLLWSFNAGWNACRAAMLQAQPQNAPQNIPEIIPDCWCRTCRPVVLNDMRFVVCPDCGNKRCPRANDHRNACTGSNEPGQEGSAYPAAPQLPGSEPATVPGKWIPVSERMPEIGDIVLTAMGGVVNVGEMECSAANCRFFTSVIFGSELPATHWMPLPAGPQEVKGE
ncbi:DUF551 domain-containing protein [Klebsiella pneumoniae]|nr:DUF551 domain-containing protein [Klebsiella pneumoniae]MDH8559155.1 DUF551 domain-containing protein [Klebsiella pneumoniae]